MAHHSKTVRPLFLSFLFAGIAASAEPLPIDPLWESESFRRTFTGSYGVDSRIEPAITTDEAGVLEKVASEMDDKDREGAIAALTGSELLGKSAALMFNLGNLRFEEGKLEDAVENFEKAIELYPNFRDAHRNLAVVMIQQDEFEEAEPHLTRAIELGARDGATMGLLGYLHAVAGRHQPALQAYRLAQMTQPGESQWKVGEAQALLSLGDNAAAESLFDSLIQDEPENRDLWIRQSQLWFASERPENAIANLELAHRISPLVANEQITLALLYLGEELLEPAERHALAAIASESAPDTDNVLDLTNFLVQTERWEMFGRIAEAMQALEDLDDDTEFARQRALYELEAGDPAVGQPLVEGILSRDPLDGKALILMARYLDRQDKTEEATHRLEQATKSPEVAAEAFLQLGRRAVERGDYEVALSFLDESEALRSSANLRTYIAEVRAIAQ